MSKPVSFAIGASEHGTLRVDLARLVDTRLLVQANSGGGKSWLLRLLAERTAGKAQLIILDPEGEFATLREKLDLALVDGGGEIATEVRTATMLARKLIEFRISAIVDLYELRLPDRREYVKLFLESLMNVPRAMWHPTIVMIDEAHIFCPERSAGESVATQAVIALMSQGRKRGFCGVLSTQRLSKLHKDAAAESNNVLIGRTWLDVDQQRAGDLLGMDKAGRQALRDLDPGEFYAFGPAFDVNGVVRFRSDKVATSHPVAGQRHEVTAPPPSASIQELVKQLGDLPKQAQQEARTVAELQAEVARLKRELTARPVQVKPEVQRIVERVEVPVLTPDDLTAIGRMGGAAQTLKAELTAVAAGLDQGWTRLVRTIQDHHMTTEERVRLEQIGRKRANVATPADPVERPVVASRPAARAATATEAGDVTISGGERRILTALAQYPGGRSKVQVAILAGYAHNGGGFNNYLGALRGKGWLEGDRDNLKITDAGIEALGSFEPLPTGQALVEHWHRSLSKAERLILNALIAVYPDTLGKVELAEQTGYESSGGGFNNALGKLRTLELIHGSHKLKAAGEFFA